MTMVLSGDRTISACGPNGQQERLLCVALFCSKRVPHSLRAYLHKLDTFFFQRPRLCSIQMQVGSKEHCTVSDPENGDLSRNDLSQLSDKARSSPHVLLADRAREDRDQGVEVKLLVQSLTATRRNAMSFHVVSRGAGPNKYRRSSTRVTLYTLKPKPGWAMGRVWRKNALHECQTHHQRLKHGAKQGR